MAARPVPDNELLETYTAFIENGRNQSRTAEALGISRGAVQDRVRKAETHGLHLSAGGREAMDATRLNGYEIAGGYRHVYDEDGKKTETVRWSVPKTGMALETIMESVKAAVEDIRPARNVAAPKRILDDLCTVYGIADAHIGLRAYGKETGADYDTDIAADRVRDWVAQCVAASPASHTGIIMDIGDLTHANDDTNLTPRSKHSLDVDTRIFRTLDVGIAALGAAIESAKAKHHEVHVVILPGNHDPTIYLAVMFAIAERYRDEPRVIVHKKPGEFFVHEFGKVMIAAHHGDKAKADRLVHFVADEFAEAWGRTKYRFLFTGHLHHHRSQDIGGLKWEQLRAVTERDAYAVSHAYSARAQLTAVTYHRERGEVQRVSVNA